MFQQHASISQRRICRGSCTCCHTEIAVADQTFFNFTQSLYADTGSTSPSLDPIKPGAWQGSHWSTSFEVTGVTRQKREWNPGLPLSGRTPYHEANEVAPKTWDTKAQPVMWICRQ